MRIQSGLTKEAMDKLQANEKELGEVRKEVEKAKAAKVPNIHLLEAKCNECQEQIELLREHYLPKPRRK